MRMKGDSSSSNYVWTNVWQTVEELIEAGTVEWTQNWPRWENHITEILINMIRNYFLLVFEVDSFSFATSSINKNQQQLEMECMCRVNLRESVMRLSCPNQVCIPFSVPYGKVTKVRLIDVLECLLRHVTNIKRSFTEFRGVFLFRRPHLYIIGAGFRSWGTVTVWSFKRESLRLIFGGEWRGFRCIALLAIHVRLKWKDDRSLMESKLRDGITLLVDRYSYSGVAFSAAKGLDIDWCKVGILVTFVLRIQA